MSDGEEKLSAMARAHHADDVVARLGDPDELDRGLLHGVGRHHQPAARRPCMGRQTRLFPCSPRAGAPGISGGTRRPPDAAGRVWLLTAPSWRTSTARPHGAGELRMRAGQPGRAGDRDAMLKMTLPPYVGRQHRGQAARDRGGPGCAGRVCGQGITVTATVSFTVPQAVAVAERHRCGAARARAAGIKPGRCFSVIMIGRLDDYLREVAQDNRAAVSEEDIRQAGLAVASGRTPSTRNRGTRRCCWVAALAAITT